MNDLRQYVNRAIFYPFLIPWNANVEVIAIVFIGSASPFPQLRDVECYVAPYGRPMDNTTGKTSGRVLNQMRWAHRRNMFHRLVFHYFTYYYQPINRRELNASTLRTSSSSLSRLPENEASRGI